jgi:hypothetical protein
MQWLKAIWHKYLFGAQQPWAVERKDDVGSLQILDYNHAYVKDLRSRLPEELVQTANDAEVIQLWVDRYNHERVEPRLEVIHSGIDQEGRIRMKLDWNHTFIRLLQERGIPGETEEEMVENYLSMMTRQSQMDAIMGEMNDGQPQPPEPSEEDIEGVLNTMDPETLRRLERTIRRRAQTRGTTRKRNIDQ